MYYTQTAQQVRTAPTSFLKGRPVASIEEARAQAIDFDGSVFYFPDVANKKIYTKQINLDGTVTMNMYEMKEIPVPTSNNFITREEFDAFKASLTSGPEAATKPPVANFNF